MDDIRSVLTTGTVSPDPEWDDTFGNWKYAIKGFDCEGDALKLIIALQPAICRITVITVF